MVRELREQQLGVPFLDANGAAVANSEGPAGNIGFPYKDEEIAYFLTMLERARVNLGPKDVEALRDSLVQLRKEEEARAKAAEAAAKQEK